MANELHTRPFPALNAPTTGVFLAIKQPENASTRVWDSDRAHLINLLDRHGAAHPSPGATHYYGRVGRYWIKWESHTEFVTDTAFYDRICTRAFDPTDFEVFPQDRFDAAPGLRLTSALIRIEADGKTEEMAEQIDGWFVSESLAVSHVLDESAVLAGDFRIDPAVHMRFAVIAAPDTGPRRIGRIVQRLCEIETYKSMSMLGQARVREMGQRVDEIETALLKMVEEISEDPAAPEDTLSKLLSLSSELEKMTAKGSFRFAAKRAYEAIINQRIDVLREERFQGRQSFREFMLRRFDPAMRTVQANECRLRDMSDPALRAADLLRTRVDVERQTQNQQLRESMKTRADLQRRLQKTVEGLSVVAIRYYVVNLADDLCPKFPPALRGVLEVKSLALGSHLAHCLALQEFHGRQVAQS